MIWHKFSNFYSQSHRRVTPDSQPDSYRVPTPDSPITKVILNQFHSPISLYLFNGKAMKKIITSAFCVLILVNVKSQNIGVGTPFPFAKLHVYNGASGAFPFAFSPLVVESNTHTYINILSPSANEGAIL